MLHILLPSCQKLMLLAVKKVEEKAQMRFKYLLLLVGFFGKRIITFRIRKCRRPLLFCDIVTLWLGNISFNALKNSLPRNFIIRIFEEFPINISHCLQVNVRLTCIGLISSVKLLAPARLKLLKPFISILKHSHTFHFECIPTIPWCPCFLSIF